MRPAAELLLPAGDGWVVRIRCSDRSHGDFCVDSAETLEERRQAFMTGRWVWLHQRHSSDVVTVASDDECVGVFVDGSVTSTDDEWAGVFADGSVTSTPWVVLAVQTADCAPVVLVGNKAFGVVHAGWKGVVAGVIETVVEAVSTLSDVATNSSQGKELRAVLGPVIRPDNYEFSSDDLVAVASAVGSDDVIAATNGGAPALDLAAAVRVALRNAGVNELDDLGLNTADERFFSHRMRRDRSRQVTVARLEPLR